MGYIHILYIYLAATWTSLALISLLSDWGTIKLIKICREICADLFEVVLHITQEKWKIVKSSPVQAPEITAIASHQTRCWTMLKRSGSPPACQLPGTSCRLRTAWGTWTGVLMGRSSKFIHGDIEPTLLGTCDSISDTKGPETRTGRTEISNRHAPYEQCNLSPQTATEWGNHLDLPEPTVLGFKVTPRLWV